MTVDPRQEIAEQLLVDNFNKTEPITSQLSDPIVDTPPAITRRPGEVHFIIRNGGNTRLSILRELWEETKDERFFSIHCLFRPWQNEIVALTGHLAENELQGKLSYIERSLGVMKVNEIYAKEFGLTLSQRQLAQKLTSDGYPISQCTISEMQEVVQYLLPIIPKSLYNGLSKYLIRKILRLRRTAKALWIKYTESIETLEQSYTFDDMFTEVLSLFNSKSVEFDVNKYQDELVGRIASIFERSYELVELDIVEKVSKQRLLETPPSALNEIDEADMFAQSKKIVTASLEELDEQQILAIPLPQVTKPAVTVTRTVNVLNTEEPQSLDYQHDTALSNSEIETAVNIKTRPLARNNRRAESSDLAEVASQN